MVISTFLKLVQGGGNIIEPFSRVLQGGKKTKSKNRKTKNKTKTTKRKKNLSRKKATRRKNLSNKRSINKRTKVKRGKTLKKSKKPRIYSKKKKSCNCDSSRYYKGNEPSPKGLGFCAHCTPLNVTMKGLDGNLWENQKYTKGKRWIKVRVDV